MTYHVQQRGAAANWITVTPYPIPYSEAQASLLELVDYQPLEFFRLLPSTESHTHEQIAA